MQGHSIVRLEDATKVYQQGKVEVRAVDRLSLDIDKGEFATLCGPSGSGKTTVLNLVGGLDVPTSGRVLLENQDLATLARSKLSVIRRDRIGFVFQSFNLINQLNVIENIEVPMYYQGFTEVESAARARELATMVGLGDRTDHRPSELSGGQQQRVAIARALANDPLIILADEPTGNLDSESGAEILNILNNLHQQGKTLIAVTHDEGIAKGSERVIRLLDGHIKNQEYNNG